MSLPAATLLLPLPSLPPPPLLPLLASLRSAKSRTFAGFRSKVVLDIKYDVPKQWANYQKDVMDSEALGKSEIKEGDAGDSGDYKGF
ncbi:hypothetical protein TeGR_g6541 [Tetraparma gracilis]|uniref:Uncharacterized protein n=1 Tax=Tetraparma gracilis TaxID=2962635 RepID=A0ABQ6M5I9_9STRA|nr:hypothetical protein TeGR_g6541 [Tetraparma gracilis]